MISSINLGPQRYSQESPDACALGRAGMSVFVSYMGSSAGSLEYDWGGSFCFGIEVGGVPQNRPLRRSEGKL